MMYKKTSLQVELGRWRLQSSRADSKREFARIGKPSGVMRKVLKVDEKSLVRVK